MLPIAGSRLKINSSEVVHQPTRRRIAETVRALIEQCRERVDVVEKGDGSLN